MNPAFDTLDTRLCTGTRGCGEWKPLDAFAQTPSGKPRSVCLVCDATKPKQAPRDPAETLRNNLKRKYGLTVEEYEAMLAAQDYRCASCHRPEAECPVRGMGRPRRDGLPPANVRRLVVDHCHESGRVRALLCSECNLTLGMHEEDLRRLAGLLRYAMWAAPLRDEPGTPAILDQNVASALSAVMSDETLLTPPPP